MKFKIEVKSTIRVILACVFAATLFFSLEIGANPRQIEASCNLAEAKKMPFSCISPDTEPSWYNVGGGSAGRPMVARSFGI